MQEREQALQEQEQEQLLLEELLLFSWGLMVEAQMQVLGLVADAAAAEPCELPELEGRLIGWSSLEQGQEGVARLQ